jgi:nucleoside 2-deoxyribosyltransferase
MNPGRPAVLCGGPIKSLFSKNVFDPAMRDLVVSCVGALRAADWTVYSAHLAEEFGPVTITSQEVTRRDNGWCVACDVYVALLPTAADGTVQPSAGTAIELGWVSAAGKPIVVVWDEARRNAYSHLVRGLDAITPVRFLAIEDVRRDSGLLVQSVGRALRPGGTDAEMQPC